MIFFCPDDSRFIKNNNIPIENFGIFCTRFLGHGEPNGKTKFKIPDSLRLGLKTVKLLKEIHRRQDENIQMLRRLYDFRVIEAEVDWRLIVGMGESHVWENGMTLHHIYGIPYIPGSTIKGAIRSVSDEGDKENLFGSQDKRGGIIFMDAYPVDSVSFALDIMNPHYPNYYSGDKYPADCQNPTPINFLTVENTKFRFVFLTQKSNAEHLNTISELLEEVFDGRGLGAKKSVGYGYFSEVKDKTANLKSHFDKLEKEQKMAAMSPVEKLCNELSALQDVNRSYVIFNEELDKFDGNEQFRLAEALKGYWERIGKWKKRKGKQKEKVKKLKLILGE